MIYERYISTWAVCKTQNVTLILGYSFKFMIQTILNYFPYTLDIFFSYNI